MKSLLSKTLSIPHELNILSYLQPRMNLSTTQKLHFQNLHKGYEGEKKLYDLFKKQLSSDYLIINDLLLKIDHTEFQIDTLLIGKNKIYLLEVKNYEGDFYIENDNWYAAFSRQEIRNPLHQLKRSELLLQKLLQQTGSRFSIVPYIIFINPEFYLYQATQDLPIIFPTQINRFIKKLNASPFNQTSQHRNVIKRLFDHHIDHSTHLRLPDYQYQDLRKGIICGQCNDYLTFNQHHFICKKCGSIEDVDSAVQRTIIEYTTLFPDKKITTNIIHEWCHIIQSKKTIRRILKKQLTSIGKGRHTYYQFKEG